MNDAFSRLLCVLQNARCIHLHLDRKFRCEEVVNSRCVDHLNLEVLDESTADTGTCLARIQTFLSNLQDCSGARASSFFLGCINEIVWDFWIVHSESKSAYLFKFATEFIKTVPFWTSVRCGRTSVTFAKESNFRNFQSDPESTTGSFIWPSQEDGTALAYMKLSAISGWQWYRTTLS